MTGGFVGVGLALLAVAAGLSAAGHHDGVLGSTDAETVLAPDGPHRGTLRIVITGTILDASHQFEAYRQTLILPGPMAAAMSNGPQIPFRLDDARGGSMAGFLLVDGAPPPPGAVLVVTGHIEVHLPLDEQRLDHPRPVPVVFVRADQVREPILFKT